MKADFSGNEAGNGRGRERLPGVSCRAGRGALAAVQAEENGSPTSAAGKRGSFSGRRLAATRLRL